MKKTAIYKTIAVAGFVMAVSAFPVLAQVGNTDTQSLMNRLNQIDTQMQTLTRYVYKGDGPAPTFEAPASNTNAVIGTFETRLGEMEEQLRSLTGQVEKMQYDVSKVSERLDSIEASAAQAMQNPVQHSNGSGGMPPLSESGSARDGVESQTMDSPSTTKNALPAGADATTSYEYAYGLLKESNFEGAEDAFSAFLEQYPDDKLATNARYWLAESFYVRGNFEAAAIRFAEAYQKDQKGPKAADNLLKLGMSLGGLGKKDDACLSLKELDKRFPDASASVKQRAGQQKATLGCS